MSRYYFSFTYIFKTFLANLDWFEFKRVMKGGVTYILSFINRHFSIQTSDIGKCDGIRLIGELFEEVKEMFDL